MSRTLRVTFCWAEVSGYMAACWRALAQQPGIDLHVLHVESLSGQPSPFDVEPLMEGLSHQPFKRDRGDIDTFLLGEVAGRRTDVVVLCGWIYWPYTRLVNAPTLARTRVVLGMDSPWSGSWTQRLARFRLGHLVPGIDCVVTASERTAEYARRIGVAPGRIRSGYYGFDYERFAAASRQRSSTWPRQFLFAGRYVAEKDVATLVQGYELYRRQVANPWSLTCCGVGPEGHLLQNRPGIIDRGFVQPSELPALFAQHGAFVLPSRFEPWGVVIAEAAASGLPVICSSACGAAADMVRPYYNGVMIEPGDVTALARAMRWVHDHEHELALVGHRGAALADAFSAASWAARWYQYLHEAIDMPR
jgi:glycosyltransferase involved in cell wall biosynthesis